MELGKKIYDLRKSRKLSQGVLADMSGLSQTYMSKIENGKIFPHISTIRKIAESLGLSCAVLLFMSCDEGDYISSSNYRAFHKALCRLLEDLSL